MKYEYRCTNCRRKFEVDVVGVFSKEKKRPISPKCPNCRSKSVKKLISLPSVKFIGSAKGGGLE